MNSSTFVVGALDGAGDMLMKSARLAGMASAKPYENLREVEQVLGRTPLAFFLFPPVPDVTKLGETVAALRGCKRRDVRCMPLLYFCAAPSRELIRCCIAMGFDDVIAMPFSQGQFEERLALQIDKPIAYCQTPGYFGPAREGKIRGLAFDLEEITGGGYTSHRFTRSLTNGIVHADRARDAA